MATCMALRSQGSGAWEEPDDLFALTAPASRRLHRVRALRRALGQCRVLVLPGQPGAQERKLGVVPAVAARDACKLVAAPLERGRPEIVGLEGEQQRDGEARPADQRLAPL